MLNGNTSMTFYLFHFPFQFLFKSNGRYGTLLVIYNMIQSVVIYCLFIYIVMLLHNIYVIGTSISKRNSGI